MEYPFVYARQLSSTFSMFITSFLESCVSNASQTHLMLIFTEDLNMRGKIWSCKKGVS